MQPLQPLKLIDKQSLQILRLGMDALRKLTAEDTKNSEFEMYTRAAKEPLSEEFLKTQLPIMTQNLIILMGSILIELIDNIGAGEAPAPEPAQDVQTT